MDDALARAHELRTRGEAFVLATVVSVARPASARPGMKAIVRADGTLEGWVGGSCAHPSVVAEGLAALSDGAPRLLRLSPEATDVSQEEGVVRRRMTCHSGGRLDIYLEPVLPRPQVVLIGEGPVVDALAEVAALPGFEVLLARAAASRGAPPGRVPLEGLAERITPASCVVVATMGAYDEETLEQVVGRGAAYVGLVASRKRADAVFAYLRARGVAPEVLERVKVPAGLDIGAVTPAEIAVSILAELIQVQRGRQLGAPRPVPPAEEERTVPDGTARDPICGMTVEMASARHVLDHEGVRVYFCSAHCRRTFEEAPARYLPASA